MKMAPENRPRTIILLAALGLLAAYAVYTNLLSGPPAAAPASATRTGESAAADAGARQAARSAAPRAGTNNGGSARDLEFHPKLRSNKKEEQIADLSKVDPTLRLDLLAKVMDVPPAGSARDLFQIRPPMPTGQEPKVARIYGPAPPAPPPPPPGQAVEGPPPPLPFKYYGFCTERINGKKTAYFLDGDDILQATEGSTIRGRYRIVQIGQTEVQVEDTQSKRRQSLHLEPEAAG